MARAQPTIDRAASVSSLRWSINQTPGNTARFKYRSPPVGDITAFIEVKTRRNLTCGRPEEAVTFLKQQRIRALARHWLHEHPGPFQRVRFDVVSIILRPGRPPEILHLKAAF
ncbi:YraN family protein [Nocardia tengchongensis]|uniref:YraN family protein n=1 Tax=Nocardia tengchongensis TaxID=2055889 RepID=A0ABX8CPI9_9NOCA|nr:YraN family protein [Nocardia tengchongensis]QVI20903.1 YraN family protein [Nocardia tengchongensis]